MPVLGGRTPTPCPFPLFQAEHTQDFTRGSGEHGEAAPACTAVHTGAGSFLPAGREAGALKEGRGRAGGAEGQPKAGFLGPTAGRCLGSLRPGSAPPPGHHSPVCITSEQTAASRRRRSAGGQDAGPAPRCRLVSASLDPLSGRGTSFCTRMNLEENLRW